MPPCACPWWRLPPACKTASKSCCSGLAEKPCPAAAQPPAGFGAATRASFDALLTEIAALDVALVMATRPAEIPAVAAHMAALAGGRIAWVGLRALGTPRARRQLGGPRYGAELLALLAGAPLLAFGMLVQMAGVSVCYDKKVVLGGIHWTVRPGER